MPASDSPADLLQDLHSAVRQWHATHLSESPESLRINYKVYNGGTTTSDIRPIPRIPLSHLFPTDLGHLNDRPDEVAWTVCLDCQPTMIGAETMYKTWDRRCYDRARASAGIATCLEQREVLLYNEDGEVMDASITTPYFFRNGRWTTPRADSGGQQGTTRRWALERDLCVEGIISTKDLQDGEVIWLSNAVRGCSRARFVIDRDAAIGKSSA